MAVSTLKMFIRKNKVPLLILSFAHALFFILSVCIFKRPYSFDSTEYIQLATNISNGFYYSGNAALPVKAEFISLRPPVYSLFIMVCWALFGYKTWAILLLQNIVSIFNCLLAKSVFDNIYPNAKQSLYYWILVIGFPMQLVYVNMVFSDVWLQCFLILYIRQLFFFIKDHRNIRLLTMSFWLILAVFTKPVVFPFLFIHGLFVLITSIKQRRLLLFSYALPPIILLFAYGKWNKKQTGLFHISSVQSVNLLTYNVAEFYLYKYGVTDMKARMNMLNKNVDTQPTFKQRYLLASRLAKEKIKAEWFDYAVFHVLKSAQLFFDPNKLELDIFTRQFHYKNNYQNSFMDSWHNEGFKGIRNYLKDYPYLPFLLITPLFGIIRITGFILFFFDKRNNIQIKIAAGIFVLYFAFITGPVANARYFMPIVLIVSACSWIGFAGLYNRIKSKQLNAAS